ncbi:MAG: VPLPA-CTERM sorting domain-containing protein [Rhodobacteraceae bacterium]|nr:VPLPA-CTERM sorting domain-containing protein [Paracoccaceae bacterium]
MREIITAAATVVALALPASATTITNGSFEDLGGQTINGNWEIFPGVPGWTGSPNVEIQTDPTIGAVDAHTHDNYVELDTNQDSSITQLINLTRGAWELTFWYSPRVNDLNTTTNDLVWSLTDTEDGSEIFSEEVTGAPNDDYPWGVWTEITTTFVVLDAGSFALTFGADGGSKYQGCGNCGALIDTVAIAPVPLPASGLLLLAGLGAVFGVRRRNAAV